MEKIVENKSNVIFIFALEMKKAKSKQPIFYFALNIISFTLGEITLNSKKTVFI